MPYILNSEEDQQEMLQAIGAGSIDELFNCIPANDRLNRPLDIPPALGELELTQHMSALAAKNVHPGQKVCFLGGGSYDHFIPAAVDSLASRGEFYTSYTPYQPEVSQGNMQAMFEYQTMIAQLTGMEVSNASLYDGGSAAIEAVLMSLVATRRDGNVVVIGSVHPEFRQILDTYFVSHDTEIITVPCAEGTVNLDDVAAAINDETACLLIQQPNFFGAVEDAEALVNLAHEKGALCVVSVDPISLGILKRPGDYAADIVVAEGQALGNPMAYGGPYLGILACREKFMRRMPGRVAGQTVDRRGKRCWVLTLQTREQHIRREKATSNICTNQGLFALRTAIYLSMMGQGGIQDVANLCLQKSNYAKQKLAELENFELVMDRPTFKEFVLRSKNKPVSEVLQKADEAGLMAGIDLGRWYPEYENCLLITVTEKRTKAEIDQLVSCFASL